jgi:hypothetical protein
MSTYYIQNIVYKNVQVITRICAVQTANLMQTQSVVMEMVS